MKCRTTRDLGVVDAWQSPLIVESDSRRFLPVGTVIDQTEHPETNCVALVRNGEAVPLDDECRAAAAMTQAQIDAAVQAQYRLHQPETPDDSEGADDEDSD
jgi:hypothetical protein